MRYAFRTIALLILLVSSTILNGQIKKFKEKNNIDYILFSAGKTWNSIDLGNTYALSLRKNVYQGLGIEGLIGMNTFSNDRWQLLKSYGSQIDGCPTCEDMGRGYFYASEGIMYGFFIDYAFRDKSREYGLIPKIGLYSVPGLEITAFEYWDNGYKYGSVEQRKFRTSTVAFSVDVKLKNLILGFSTDYFLEIYKFHLGYVFNDKKF